MELQPYPDTSRRIDPSRGPRHASGEPEIAALPSCSRRGECRGNTKRSVDRFDEIPFFTKDEPFALRHREVFAPVRIGLQAGAVRSYDARLSKAIKAQATSFVPSCGRNY